MSFESELSDLQATEKAEAQGGCGLVPGCAPEAPKSPFPGFRQRSRGPQRPGSERPSASQRRPPHSAAFLRWDPQHAVQLAFVPHS